VSKSTRIRREKPERTGPIRSFSKLIAEPGATNGHGAADDSGSSAKGSASAGDPIADGVKRAYQVIDRYINEGRRVAGQFAGANSTAAASAPGNLQSLFEQMMRRQTELLPLWLEMLGALGAVERPSVAPSHPDAATANGVARIAIEVSSRAPVQVELDLRERPPIGELAIPGLHRVEGESPPIKDIAFVSDSGADVLRIRVPDDQPAGVYAGVIVNRKSGHPCGSLIIRVRE
jgi:hypothetical protein